MDKEKLVIMIKKLIDSYKEENNNYFKGAVIAMTTLLDMINNGLFDIDDVD